MSNTEIFRREAASHKGSPIGAILRHKEVKGDIGIEIEMEGKRLLHAEDEGNIIVKGWRYHVDHSLRGEENAEYVMDGPVPFNRVEGELQRLWGALEDNGAIIDESNRTSVHVHMNCQKMFLNEFTSFAATYFALEEILTEWCGDHRVGNLFCLRAKDAPGIITAIESFIVDNGDRRFPEALHYAAFNPQALNKFGSIEIRTMRGTPDYATVLAWSQILQRIYEFARSFKDPRDVCQMFSAGGPITFFETVLGDKADFLRKELGLGDTFIRNSIYEGIRLAQRLCYCRDWSKFEQIELEPDPFGRSPASILGSLNGPGAAAPAPSISYDFEDFEPEYDTPPMPTMPTMPAPQSGMQISLLQSIQQAQLDYNTVFNSSLNDLNDPFFLNIEE